MTQRYEDSPEARMEAALAKGLLKDVDDQAAPDELLLAAREIASDTTMNKADEGAWLSGSRDHLLASVIRRIASHSLKTIEVQNREKGDGLVTNPAAGAFEAYQKTIHYMTDARWGRDFPERIPDCLWRAFLAGFNAAQRIAA